MDKGTRKRIEKLKRIQARNQAWFPNYRAAHEMYCEQAKFLLKEQSVILHFGAGRDSLGIVDSLRNCSGKIVSFDIDQEGLSRNTNAPRVQGDGRALPFKEKSFDLIMADNVFEHLEDPHSVLSECRRCLKPSGALVFLCPNRFSYISLAASLTSYWFHSKFKWLTMRTADSDTFPTYYRLNSMSRIIKVASQAGFKTETINSYVGWPTYWEFSDHLHRLFVLVHKCLEAFPSWCHITLVGALRCGDSDLSGASTHLGGSNG